VKPSFFKELFLDGDKASFSRAISAFIVISAVGWVTFLVLKNGQLPDLGGVAGVITGGALGFYGANKVSTAISGQPPTG
jgi:multisubunit Na+/H+ antiporter MnhB subunit